MIILPPYGFVLFSSSGFRGLEFVESVRNFGDFLGKCLLDGGRKSSKQE